MLGQDPKGAPYMSWTSLCYAHIYSGLVGGKSHHISCVTASRLLEISTRFLITFSTAYIVIGALQLLSKQNGLIGTNDPHDLRLTPHHLLRCFHIVNDDVRRSMTLHLL